MKKLALAAILAPFLALGTARAEAPAPIALGAYIQMNGQYIEDHPGLIDAYAALVGRMPALVEFGSDMAHGYPFDTATFAAVAARGAMPVYTLDPAYSDGSGFQPTYTDLAIAQGKFDTYFISWARQAAWWGRPLILRFAPEMNGWWSSWSTALGNADNNRPGDYVAAWRHVHDLFVAAGARNVRWFWCPNTDDPSTTPYAQDYPGDSYVDYVGMDGYNWGGYPYHTWRTLAQVFSRSYGELAALTAKPMIIGETGSVELGGNKPDWLLRGFIDTIPNQFPRVRAVIVTEANLEHDWRVDSSPLSLGAFRAVASSPIYQGRLQ